MDESRVQEAHSDREFPPLVPSPYYSDDSESDDDDSTSDDDQYYMFENGNNVLMSEDFDELYVSPRSRHVQFQPTRTIPEPTGTEN